MKIKCLNKENNKNLLLFFNGWGFDERIIKHLDCTDFDVFELHDYRSLEPVNIDFSCYEKKYLAAWSLGVFVANFYYDTLTDFSGFTAVNGTKKPVDDDFGISVNAYNLTIDNFNEKTREKFIRKIEAPFEIDRSNDELKQELIFIRDLKPLKFLNFNKAIISTKDKIFPYKNMYSFWKKEKVEMEDIEAPHYVFDKFKKWSDLI